MFGSDWGSAWSITWGYLRGAWKSQRLCRLRGESVSVRRPGNCRLRRMPCGGEGLAVSSFIRIEAEFPLEFLIVASDLRQCILAAATSVARSGDSRQGREPIYGRRAFAFRVISLSSARRGIGLRAPVVPMRRPHAQAGKPGMQSFVDVLRAMRHHARRLHRERPGEVVRPSEASVLRVKCINSGRSCLLYGLGGSGLDPGNLRCVPID